MLHYLLFRLIPDDLGPNDFNWDFCKNKRIHHQINKCDGVFDCSDRSDESDCPHFFKESNTYLPVSCKVNTTNNYYNHSEPGNEGFQCGPNKCLDINFWCKKNLFSIKFPKAIREILESECKSLFELIDNDIFCKNLTFWENKTCNGLMKRCKGNIPGQCVFNYRSYAIEKTCRNKLQPFANQHKNSPPNDDDDDDFGPDYFMDVVNPACKDLSDNFGCNQLRCQSKNLIMCENAEMCIHEGLLCDGHNNCPNGTDEGQILCEKCPRDFGHPFGKSKFATFSCLHRYTNTPICAVPCDGIDDLCKDYSDELCDSQPMEKLIGVVLLLFILTIFIGESTIHLHTLQSNNLTYENKDSYPDISTNITLLSGQLKDGGTLHHKHLQTLINRIFKEKQQLPKNNMVLSLLSNEMWFHGHPILNGFICIKNNIKATKEAKHFFEIVEDVNSFLFKPRAKLLYVYDNFQKHADYCNCNIFHSQHFKKFWITFIFICRISINIFGFSFDLLKDICFVALIYDKLFPLKWSSFGFNIFSLLSLSIVLPLLGNLLLVLNLHSCKQNLWIIATSLTLFFPIAPCIAIYISNRLAQSMNRFNENFWKHNFFVEYTKNLRMLCFEMKLNENAIENPLQILIFVLIICIDLSETASVLGFQNLFVRGETFLIYLSLTWSFASMVYGHVKWLVEKKNNFLSIWGMICHGIFVLLSLAERVCTIVIYFSPSLGLFNLLGHWNIKNINFENNTQVEIHISEKGIVSEIEKKWLSVENYVELTFLPLETFFYISILLLILHVIFTALIKYYAAIYFSSKKTKIEMMLHLITQITCPLSFTDWDEDIQSEKDVKKNWKKVKNEMKCMLGLFFIEHIIMTIPLWILTCNIFLRNQYLDRLFPQVIAEQRATFIANTLSLVCPIVHVILLFIKYHIFLLYHRHFHPWSMILKAFENPEAYKRIEGLARTSHLAFKMEHFERSEHNKDPQILLDIKEQAVRYTKPKQFE